NTVADDSCLLGCGQERSGQTTGNDQTRDNWAATATPGSPGACATKPIAPPTSTSRGSHALQKRARRPCAFKSGMNVPSAGDQVARIPVRPHLSSGVSLCPLGKTIGNFAYLPLHLQQTHRTHRTHTKSARPLPGKEQSGDAISAGGDGVCGPAGAAAS